MTDLTQILSAIEQGDPRAAEQLLPLVYEELRDLAAQKMEQERLDHTLEATALVHEAYLRLVDVDRVQHWNSRGHFFAAAAEAMRRILIENARRRRRLKHGGERVRVDFQDAQSLAAVPADDLLELDDALNRLAAFAPEKAELVKLRFFAGLTTAEAAQMLGISLATGERYWTYARVWLYCELYGDPPPPKA